MRKALIVLALLPATVAAQGRVIDGIVTARGVPVTNVNVFDLVTLAGSVTREDGRFSFVLADTTRATVHLATRAIGFAPLDTTVALARLEPIVLTLRRLTILLPIAVQAGRYTANATPTTNLTALEVATIPGSNADINGAIKTLPGVQNVDEGSGLFVRGGDFTETRTFVDGAPLFTAYQFDAPTGSVAGTINPFLTSAITFSSGGFGPEWGNALSGVVDLRTQGRPSRSFTNVNASILGLSLSQGFALDNRLGFSTTVGVTDLTRMFQLSGNPRGYAPAPHARTASALANWDYSADGGVKVFALYQANGFGIPISDPSLTTTFASNRTSDLVVASWRDSAGLWRPFVSASTSGFSRHETKGAYDQSTSLRSTQLRVESPFVFTDRLTTTVGGEVERIGAVFGGQLPANGYNATPGAPTTPSTLDASASRTTLFSSIDMRPTGSTQFIAGLRSTTSGFTIGRSNDPRLSAAWIPYGPLTLTVSWGVYHQIADPAFLDRSNGATQLPALGSRMAIAGAQYGEGTRMTRFEVWTRTYDHLVGLTRSYATVSGLNGRAHGADLLVRAPLTNELNVRLTFSNSWSHRADPNTGIDAPATFDVTNSVTAVVQKTWGRGWSAGIATRLATGHPFTDVTSATFDPQANVFTPNYGPPDAERLPDFSRTDIIVSRQHPFGEGRYGIAFISVNNILNQVNTFGYTWSRDYTQRIRVRSTINRTLFVGANLVLLH